MERGGSLTVTGTGFAAGENVSGVMNSEPLALGTRSADADGAVTFTWTIPRTRRWASTRSP
ncbi:hypothetical protein [Microbacterium sp. NIBRBAC000506063]|uniref:hypothetical protein n=1 Tax=Microbacterium sp. NIBRBAC000506063 TaxID=2734618 RepID=UPI001BB6F36D|nr:hypothetical protein [Microbacterium sp. NIBRBAC000506063]QTV80519.1 hypothetical protein KAE78_06440 [Microbacterium sp. NIBRBAC000506063]